MRTKLFLPSILFILLGMVFCGLKCEAIIYICIDPGHGDNASGSEGQHFHSLEKNANLKVGLALRDSLNAIGYPDSTVRVIMTRTSDTNPSFQQRAAIAMGNNEYSKRANQFIVIHHNGTTNDTINYIMSYVCTYVDEIPSDTTDRNISKNLVDRVQAKMVDILGYKEASQRLKDSCLYVLEYTSMISVYPEVSFMTCRKIDSLFCYDTTYSRKEGGSIYRGWRAYMKNDPIVIVKNHFGGGVVYVDGYYRESPFYGAWCSYDWHTIGAADQSWDGDNYYYCKWSDAGADSHEIWVHPWDDSVTAFFSYDHYWARVNGPNGGENYEVGKSMRIYWSADTGVYDPPYSGWTYMDFYLSRNGGANYETITANYWTMGKTSGYYDWTVNGIASNQCRIKIVAHDDACNQAEDVSNNNFSLKYIAAVQAPLAGEEWEIGDNYHIITWSASPGHNSSTLIDILISRNGGTNWETIATNQVNDGSYQWEVNGGVSANCLNEAPRRKRRGIFGSLKEIHLG